MVRLVRGLVRLEEREELLRAGGARALRLGGGLRGRGGEGGLGGVPGGELAREVGGEGGRLGRGREGVVLDDADVGVLGLVCAAPRSSGRTSGLMNAECGLRTERQTGMRA